MAAFGVRNFYNRTWTEEEWDKLLFPGLTEEQIKTEKEARKKKSEAIWSAHQAKGIPPWANLKDDGRSLQFNQQPLCLLDPALAPKKKRASKKKGHSKKK